MLQDRPLGIRLLCAMAAGHRDRTLRCASETVEARKVAMPSTAEGLEWSLHGIKALLPRHSLLKAALPPADPASEQVRVGRNGLSSNFVVHTIVHSHRVRVPI